MLDHSQYICTAGESAMLISLYSSYTSDPMQISFSGMEIPSAGHYFSIRVGEDGLFRLAEDWRERIEKLCLTIVQTVKATVKTAVKQAVELPLVSFSFYKKTAIFRAIRKLRL